MTNNEIEIRIESLKANGAAWMCSGGRAQTIVEAARNEGLNVTIRYHRAGWLIEIV